MGEVGSGHTVGIGLSNIVLRRLGCVLEVLQELGFRVGVSTSDSGLLSSSLYRFIMNCVGEKGLLFSVIRELALWRPRLV